MNDKTAVTPQANITAKLERDLREVLAEYYLSRLVTDEQIIDTLEKITVTLRAVTKAAS